MVVVFLVLPVGDFVFAVVGLEVGHGVVGFALVFVVAFVVVFVVFVVAVVVDVVVGVLVVVVVGFVVVVESLTVFFFFV